MTSQIPSEPLERVRFFSGQLLTVEDFAAEQNYHRERQRRHNLLVHGWGVACGLEVSVTAGEVRVQPGCALDPLGNEIVLPHAAELPLPPERRPHCLFLRYAERQAGAVPVLAAGESRMEATRIVEGFELAWGEPAAGERAGRSRCGHLDASGTALALARLVHRRGAWRLDRCFRPRRLRR